MAYKWKVVVIGDPTVGKTTLMLRYTEKKFNELYIPTVGVQVSVKQIPIIINHEKMLADLNIWDIAGHVKFQHIRQIFYEGASAFLLLYDITNEATFEGTSYWIEDVQKIIGKQVGVLIGNKRDLQKERMVSKETGKARAEQYKVEFLETSAKTGENVNEAFRTITHKLLSKFE
ncbi:MAG: Rab family GTPase [Candidatus Helarchaeota archaeon]